MAPAGDGAAAAGGGESQAYAAVKDLVSGTFGGFAQVAAGHPLGECPAPSSAAASRGPGAARELENLAPLLLPAIAARPRLD